MAMKLEEGGEKKTCPICGSTASRLVAAQGSKDTRLAFQLVDVIDPDPRHPHLQPINLSMLFKAFGCENKKCGHVDLYAYVGSPEISP